MYCKYCGKEVPNDSNFCPSCGRKLYMSPSFKEKYAFPNLLSNSRKGIYYYVLWFLLNVGLYIFAAPESHREKNFGSIGFYPFDKSISSIFQGEKYRFSLLNNIDYYDFSEFFFYTLLLPVFIVVVLKSKPFKFSKKTYILYVKKQVNNIEKRISNIYLYITSYFASHKYRLNSAYSNLRKIIKHGKATRKESEEVDLNEVTVEIQTDTIILNTDARPLPLFRRFIGSVIDKVLIIVLFIGILILINPFGSSRLLGYYFVILQTSPIEYMKSLDIQITSWLILFNFIYFLFFEYFFSASLGKRLLGGIIIEDRDSLRKMSFLKVAMRRLLSALFSFLAVWLLHFICGLSYILVLFIYLLLVDIPVLFCKLSLLDLCSGTICVRKDRKLQLYQNKDNWNWLYAFLFGVLFLIAVLVLFVRFHLMVFGGHTASTERYTPTEELSVSSNETLYSDREIDTPEDIAEKELENDISEANTHLPYAVNDIMILISIKLTQNFVEYSFVTSDYSTYRMKQLFTKNSIIKRLQNIKKDPVLLNIALTNRDIIYRYENLKGEYIELTIENSEIRKIC